MADLALAEYRRLLAISPDETAAWREFFHVYLPIGKEIDILPDYREFSRRLIAVGDFRGAIDILRKVIALAPNDLEAKREFIRQYPKAGKLNEIVDDMLAFAQNLVDAGEVDEAVAMFQLVTSIDPRNTLVKEMLTATQTRTGTEVRRRLAEGDPTLGLADRPLGRDAAEEFDLSDTQIAMIGGEKSPTDLLMGTLDEMDRKEGEEALAQIVEDYRDILAVNPQNAEVRVKIADVYKQLGQITETLSELSIAVDIYIARNDLGHAVTNCERILAINPSDQKTRKRLNETILRRDALKALDSDIFFGDTDTGKK